MTSFISVRFGCRSDAGCKYWLRVRLVNGDMEEIDKREINEEKEACGDWFHVSISLLLCPLWSPLNDTCILSKLPSHGAVVVLYIY